MDAMRDMANDPQHRRTFEKLLILAAKKGDAEQVAERLGWGIDPNCTYCKNRTPLIANVRSASPNAKVVQDLLKAGADPLHVDETGLTALDYARRKLSRLHSKPRKPPRKSPSLDENDQLSLSKWEQDELDDVRSRLGPDAKEFIRIYWQERLKAARRVFNDPGEVERIVEVLERTM